jgi:hypothetical protein
MAVLARLRMAEAKGILASFLFQEINIYSYRGWCGGTDFTDNNIIPGELG